MVHEQHSGAPERRSRADPVFDYAAGATAGAVNVVTGYPFDTVKVRLQANMCRYDGAWACFRSIVRHEGVSGVFRGLTPPLIGTAVETGINYCVFEAVAARLGAAGVPDAAAVPASAVAAGFCLSFVISPAELIKCRMQLGASDVAHSYAGPVDAIRQVLRAEGLRGLCRGLGATMAREMPGNAIYFSTYKWLRSRWNGNNGNHGNNGDLDKAERTLWETLVDGASAATCGAAAGMVMWAAVLPLDSAKTRIQTAWPGSPRDVGVMAALRAIYREGGRRALYAGLTPTLVRAAPANAAQWLTWEFLVREWEAWKDGGSRDGGVR